MIGDVFTWQGSRWTVTREDDRFTWATTPGRSKEVRFRSQVGLSAGQVRMGQWYQSVMSRGQLWQRLRDQSDGRCYFHAWIGDDGTVYAQRGATWCPVSDLLREGDRLMKVRYPL